MVYRFDSGPDPINDPRLHEHFTQHMSGLLDEEIERILAYCENLALRPVGLAAKHDETHVKAVGGDFPLTAETRWVYDRIAALVPEINADYRFDLSGFEPFYFMRYTAPGEHFGWHYDSGPHTKRCRKLSLTLQLSDPSEYEGGEFEVQSSTKTFRALKQRGLLTAFPSYKTHRVTPVTKGVRKVLTMFIFGPNLR